MLDNGFNHPTSGMHHLLYEEFCDETFDANWRSAHDKKSAIRNNKSLGEFVCGEWTRRKESWVGNAKKSTAKYLFHTAQAAGEYIQIWIDEKKRRKFVSLWLAP